MKRYKNTRIAIIGFGFLMGYLFECIKEFLGEDNLASNIIAVTADESTINEKREKYPFRIILSSNLEALRVIKPEIILFAPPPAVAPEIISGELKTYFNECEKKPDIYAFPPSPSGRYYMDILGEDIFVCNILPNMVKEIGGKALNGSEGYSTLTYPEGIVLSVFNKNRVKAFLKPLGGTIEVSSDKIMKVLAAYVMIDLWPHRLLSAGRELGLKNFRDIIENNGYIQEISNVIIRFLVDSGIDEKAASYLVEERNSLVFHLIRETDEEGLVKDMISHSTKGGVFEKGYRLHEIIIDQCSFEFINKKGCDLKKAVYSCLQIIAEHGKNLAETDETKKLHPGIHGMIFALFVRKIRKELPEKSEKIIENAVKEYGRQRGHRMRLRAIQQGYNGSMDDYMAFGEWSAEEDSMEIRTISEKEPVITRVYKCPWCTEWEKFGFINEGRYYCRFVDESLVKGFNDSLELKINSIRPDGSEYCEFIWNGAGLGKTINIDSELRVMPWKFHIAHLLRIIEGSTRAKKEIFSSIKEDISVLYSINPDQIIEEYKDYDFISI